MNPRLLHPSVLASRALGAPLSLITLLSGGCASQKDELVTRNNIQAVIESDWSGSSRRPKRKLHPETEKAFRLEKEADAFVEMTSDGRFDIGITDRNGGRVDFQPDQLIHHFSQQRHKNLVVICFHKQAWPDEVLKERIESTNRYFFDRGYRRVVIQQYMGFGRPTHSDRKRP